MKITEKFVWNIFYKNKNAVMFYNTFIIDMRIVNSAAVKRYLNGI